MVMVAKKVHNSGAADVTSSVSRIVTRHAQQVASPSRRYAPKSGKNEGMDIQSQAIGILLVFSFSTYVDLSHARHLRRAAHPEAWPSPVDLARLFALANPLS